MLSRLRIAEQRYEAVGEAQELLDAIDAALAQWWAWCERNGYGSGDERLHETISDLVVRSRPPARGK